MQPVRWGILSTAKIGRTKVIPGMMKSPHCDIVAIASRDGALAHATAADLSIRKSYGSYEALFADPEIEAIYNPLPNHLHVPMTLAAAPAGKHVLCEKPIALDAAGALRLKDITNVLVAEAFMVRQHPQWLAARDIVRQGRIGSLKSVQVAFSYANLDPDDIRNKADIGGGGLLDLGCYAIVAGRFLFEADPLRMIGLIDRDPVFGTDRNTSGLADFGAGRQLSFTVATQSVPYQRVQAFGATGRVEIEIPFNARPDEPTRIFVDDGSGLADRSAEPVVFPVVDQYQLQGESFGRAIRGLEPQVWGIDDAILNMRILDALTRSQETGVWEVP